MNLRDTLRMLGSADRRDGRNLSNAEARDIFGQILDRRSGDIQVAGFLMALRWKGVTVEELIGFVQAARERAELPCEGLSGMVTLCTPHDGYDQTPPLEVAAALVAAAAGARVMLVSEMGVPPRRGVTAALTLESLGVSLATSKAEAEDRIERQRFVAIAVTTMLPGLGRLHHVRGELGVRTALSTIEKLIAPGSSAIVTSAQSGPVLGTAVETMAGLGHPSGIVIQGLEGGLIPTLKRRTRGVELAGSHQVPLTVEPNDFGLLCRNNPELPMFGPPEEGLGTGDNPLLMRAALDSIRGVLAGETGPARSATLLCAAVVLKAVGRAMTLAEGVDAAVEALDSGAARKVLQDSGGTA
ncbi:MAG: hypothetical protein WD226_08005 [Planctomycetota bacterium]